MSIETYGILGQLFAIVSVGYKFIQQIVVEISKMRESTSDEYSEERFTEVAMSPEEYQAKAMFGFFFLALLLHLLLLFNDQRPM